MSTTENYSWNPIGVTIRRKVMAGDIEGAKAYATKEMSLTQEEASAMVDKFNR